MKITLLQTDIIWENKDKNFGNIEALISSVPADTEIIILPEMFNTGFSMNPADLSEAPFSVTLEWMRSVAKDKCFGVCGSYIVKEDNHFFNRWVFVSPENEIWSYDKRHLFSPGGEKNLFTMGTNRIISISED